MGKKILKNNPNSNGLDIKSQNKGRITFLFKMWKESNCSSHVAFMVQGSLSYLIIWGNWLRFLSQYTIYRWQTVLLPFSLFFKYNSGEVQGIMYHCLPMQMNWKGLINLIQTRQDLLMAGYLSIWWMLNHFWMGLHSPVKIKLFNLGTLHLEVHLGSIAQIIVTNITNWHKHLGSVIHALVTFHLHGRNISVWGCHLKTFIWCRCQQPWF